MTDAELLELYRLRDERALTETDREYGRLCRSLAVRILGDRQDAEECVNDVLMKLWDSIPPAKPEHLTAFITAVTRNLCFDRLRSAKRMKRGGGMLPAVLDELEPYLASEDDPEECIGRIALQDSIARFLAALPKESRMIFLARYWSFQPVADIARHHGATVGSVKMQLKRVREKLRTHLEKEGLL